MKEKTKLLTDTYREEVGGIIITLIITLFFISFLFIKTLC